MEKEEVILGGERCDCGCEEELEMRWEIKGEWGSWWCGHVIYWVCAFQVLR
jgi:hypothetical protein